MSYLQRQKQGVFRRGAMEASESSRRSSARKKKRIREHRSLSPSSFSSSSEEEEAQQSRRNRKKRSMKQRNMDTAFQNSGHVLDTVSAATFRVTRQSFEEVEGRNSKKLDVLDELEISEGDYDDDGNTRVEKRRARCSKSGNEIESKKTKTWLLQRDKPPITRLRSPEKGQRKDTPSDTNEENGKDCDSGDSALKHNKKRNQKTRKNGKQIESGLAIIPSRDELPEPVWRKRSANYIHRMSQSTEREFSKSVPLPLSYLQYCFIAAQRNPSQRQFFTGSNSIRCSRKWLQKGIWRHNLL